MHVNLKQWSAWSPTVETESEWKSWAVDPVLLPEKGSPKLPFIPAIRRRRMSKLARMIMQVAFSFSDVIDLSEVNSVFASHHGELDTTLELTDLLINEDLFSPQKFSHSVHNTTSGLFSIEVGNREAATALSGGEASFCYGFLEALTMQYRFPQQKTLLVVADESVPACFEEYGRTPKFPYAAAFLLSGDNNQGDYRLKLSLNPCTMQELTAEQTLKFPQALLFLRWLLSTEKRFTLFHHRQSWTWEKLFG